MFKELQKNFRRNEFGKILDCVTRTKIILIGVSATIIFSILSYLIFLVPLNARVENGQEQITHYKQSINSIQKEQSAYLRDVPLSTELPKLLSSLRVSLETDSLVVEEMLLNQHSIESDGELSEALIKCRVTGEGEMILQAMADFIRGDCYPYIVQEIDLKDKQGLIDLKILFKNN